MLGWSLGLAFLVSAGMAKYGASTQSGQSLNDLIAHMPKSIQAVLGAFDLSTAIGYFAVIYLYLAMLMSVHAAMIGSDSIAKEERDETADFLLTKPVTRAKVVTAKLAAALIQCAVLNALVGIDAVKVVGYYAKGASVNHQIGVFMAGLAMLQILFLAVGVGIAGLVRNPKQASAIATGAVLGTFVLSVAISMNEHLAVLKYLTPFKYFAAEDLMSGRLDSVFIGITTGLVVILVGLAYIGFQKKDL